MTKPPLLKLIRAAAFAALCLFVQPAWSLTIDATDISDGSAHVRDDVDGFDVYANGGTFWLSDLHGWSGFFGVYNASSIVPEEVDVFGESIVITFDTPHVIEAIQIGRLFEEDQYGDKANEAVDIIAELEVTGDVVALGAAGDLVELLEVIDATSASWTGPDGVVSNLSPGERGNAGVWQILDPFGSRAVTSLRFNPHDWPDVNPENGGQNSDFALLSVTTTVPEPQTAVLFGVGMAGLGFLGRRRR